MRSYTDVNFVGSVESRSSIDYLLIIIGGSRRRRWWRRRSVIGIRSVGGLTVIVVRRLLMKLSLIIKLTRLIIRILRMRI